MDELEIRAPALRKLVKSDPSIPSYKISDGKMQYKSQLYATKNANGYTELFVDDKQYGRLNYTDLINITKHLNCHRKNKEYYKYYNTNYYGFTSILKDDFESSAINEQGKKYKPLSTQQIKFMLEDRFRDCFSQEHLDCLNLWNIYDIKSKRISQIL